MKHAPFQQQAQGSFYVSSSDQNGEEKSLHNKKLQLLMKQFYSTPDDSSTSDHAVAFKSLQRRTLSKGKPS